MESLRVDGIAERGMAQRLEGQRKHHVLIDARNFRRAARPFDAREVEEDGPTIVVPKGQAESCFRRC